MAEKEGWCKDVRQPAALQIVLIYRGPALPDRWEGNLIRRLKRDEPVQDFISISEPIISLAVLIDFRLAFTPFSAIIMSVISLVRSTGFVFPSGLYSPQRDIL